jgi:hypothetical protein
MPSKQRSSRALRLQKHAVRSSSRAWCRPCVVLAAAAAAGLMEGWGLRCHRHRSKLMVAHKSTASWRPDTRFIDEQRC